MYYLSILLQHQSPANIGRSVWCFFPSPAKNLLFAKQTGRVSTKNQASTNQIPPAPSMSPTSPAILQTAPPGIVTSPGAPVDFHMHPSVFNNIQETIPHPDSLRSCTRASEYKYVSYHPLNKQFPRSARPQYPSFLRPHPATCLNSTTNPTCDLPSSTSFSSPEFK